VRIRTGQPAEALAEGVLAFDLGGDGSLLHSTGRAIHYVGSDGRHQRLIGGERVEAVVVLS
jgi:hypothetical protein